MRQQSIPHPRTPAATRQGFILAVQGRSSCSCKNKFSSRNHNSLSKAGNMINHILSMAAVSVVGMLFCLYLEVWSRAQTHVLYNTYTQMGGDLPFRISWTRLGSCKGHERGVVEAPLSTCETLTLIKIILSITRRPTDPHASCTLWSGLRRDIMREWIAVVAVEITCNRARI